MTMDRLDVLAFIVSKMVDRHGSNVLDELVEGLPDDEKAWIYREIKKNPVDADIESLDQPIETERPRYTIRNATYYLSERPAIVRIVGDLIREASVNLLIGLQGAKKTWVMLDLGVCTASGKDWLGMAIKQCNVLIIDEESGDSRLADRIKMVMKGELADDDVPIFSVSLAQFNLLKRLADVDEMIALIEAVDAKLVIIDALADIMIGGDENAVKDTQPVFASLRKIAEVTGVAFIVIHHVNKVGGYRGSSAIAGAVDTMILIESKPDSDIVTFKTEKMRDGTPLKFAGQAVWSDNGFYMIESDVTERVFLTKVQRYALDYFKENGDATLKQLNDYADGLYSSDSLKKAIQYLVSQDHLTRRNPGGSGRIEAIYGIKNR